MPLDAPLLDALDRMGYGGIILAVDGAVISVNPIGIKLLGVTPDSRDRHRDRELSREALKALLRSEGSSRFRMDEDSWMVFRTPGIHLKRQLVLHAMPLQDTASTGAHTLVVIVDLQAMPEPRAEALQKIFSLTAAEARLALEIARGSTLDEVGLKFGGSVATLRKQLASVFSKTGTHRQAQLVALLARVSILP